jgi:hypothetical protein
MKHLFLFILTIGFTIISIAQTKGSAKLYGFKEPVTSGVAPSNIEDGNGKEIKNEAKSTFNYFIYLQTISRVYPSEMWINGVPYSVKVETIKSTPVKRDNSNNPSQTTSTILVPKTTHKVVMLTPAPAINDKLSKKGRSLSKDNELVVVYKQAGKFYYSNLKKMKELEAAIMQ